MTKRDREEVLAERQSQGLPWHAPAHFGSEQNSYLISAACFEHEPIMQNEARRTAFARALIEGLASQSWAEVRAWVILPNHYHMLVKMPLPEFRRWIHRLHNGKATEWNREDRMAGRKVWYRFSDRAIRGERHYFASLNYVHANPVKHGYVGKAYAWEWSSAQSYLDRFGREQLHEWWKACPIDAFGTGWDD